MMTNSLRVNTAIIALTFVLLPGMLRGQDRDFQTWWEFEFDKSLGSSLQLEGELEQRFRSNSLQYDRTLLTLGAEYDVASWLSLAGAGRVVFVADKDRRVHPRYRVHVNATGSYKWSGFTFSIRTRMQYGFEEFMYFGDWQQNSLVSRNRLKARYHFFGTRISSFAALESWHNLSRLPDPAFVHMRYQAGLSFEPNFRSTFTLRYLFEDEFNVNNPDRLHILLAGYAHHF
jgi:hypothetical protein